MGPAISVILGITTYAAIGAIFTHQHGDRAIPFGLDQDPPFEFHRRANHGSQRHRLAQDTGQMGRIVMAMQNRRQAFSAHANGTATHGALVDLEVDDEVTVRTGCIGHGMAFRRGA